MVTALQIARAETKELSVLALSSRFDGPLSILVSIGRSLLSVLALSSRFDGLLPSRLSPSPHLFQYSLCRVVLMVV